MSTEILPHKALNDISSMHHYLKQKLISSKQVTDLIPFINILSNVEELKKQLLSSLDEQYEKENSTNHDSKSKLRSLFVSLFSLNGIPSDIIHAQIISFLPCKEYKKIPILSSHFRNVMKNHPFIFNNKKYCVNLKFSQRKLSSTKSSIITIKHTDRTLNVSPPNNRHKKSNKTEHSINTQNCIIQFDKIKCWNVQYRHIYGLFHSSINSDDDNKEDYPVTITEDKHNKFSLDLLTKHSNSIEKLDIKCDNHNILKSILNLQDSFISLHALCLKHTEWNLNAINLSPGSFNNLSYFELGVNKHSAFQSIQNIVEFVSKSLKAFKMTHIHSPRDLMHSYGSRHDVNRMKEHITLKMPANLEWICVQNVGLTLDLTECDKLVGVKLISVESKRIFWPKKHTYLIPFVCLGDTLRNNDWEDMTRNKQINGKFILLKKVKFKTRDESRAHNAMLRHPRRKQLMFNDKEDIDRINIDHVLLNLKGNKDEKCLILQENNIDKGLFEKILKYNFQDENLRNMKRKQYMKWKMLNCANWVYNLNA